jgi:hypothetical protein
MVYQKFYGEEGQFYGWRCIFCGEIVDEVISKNRDRWEANPSFSRGGGINDSPPPSGLIGSERGRWRKEI